MTQKHVRKNRDCWDAISSDYHEKHGEELDRAEAAWGAWAIPERELQVLGPVKGLDMLELGCGGAQWGRALATQGAHVIGLDVSDRQLRYARDQGRAKDIEFPLLLANAEALPLADASFDVVFCDHGAMTFTDPCITVPEVARVLRPGGLFAFNMIAPLAHVCWSTELGKTDDRLHSDYFGLRKFEDDDHVEFQLNHGEWIRLFRKSGLNIEDLIELQAPEGAETSFDDYVSHDWARRWPAENIWKLRKGV
jgi:SAM-dependent methyltransferase